MIEAGIGPVSIKTGSSPTTEIDTISALGFAWIFFKPASLHMTTAAAPSVIWLALPAVMTPLSVTGFSPDSLSKLASNLIPSSAITRSFMPSAFLPSTGNISLSKYFTEVPGTDSGNEEDKTAFLAMFPDWAPTWSTQPKITSSTRAGSISNLVTSSSKTLAPKSAGCHKLSLPSLFPPAVRTASTIYAFSAIKKSLLI